MQQEDANQNFSFPKKERISSNLVIERLVRSQQSVSSYPLKCYYTIEPVSTEIVSHRMAVSVPKRLFKHAVDRNYIKRLVRENYRLNKSVLLRSIADTGCRVDMLFIFVGKSKPRFPQVEKSLTDILEKIVSRS